MNGPRIFPYSVLRFRVRGCKTLPAQGTLLTWRSEWMVEMGLCRDPKGEIYRCNRKSAQDKKYRH
jgi:hypothetical protein